MAPTRVPLSRVYIGHGSGTQVALVSEPTGGLYLDHGEPAEVQRTAAGEVVVIEHIDVVRAYVEACVTFEGESEPSAILRQLSLADIRKVKDALLDFFKVAGTSGSSGTSSSSAPDGTPPTPTA